jgi:putative transposase
VAEPRKRPKAATRRFAASQPNMMWQMDAVDYRLSDGTVVVVIQVLDDCSRLDLADLAAVSENGDDVWVTMQAAISRYGLPQLMLRACQDFCVSPGHVRWGWMRSG